MPISLSHLNHGTVRYADANSTLLGIIFSRNHLTHLVSGSTIIYTRIIVSYVLVFMVRYGLMGGSCTSSDPSQAP